MALSIGGPGPLVPRANEPLLHVLIAADCSGRGARAVREPLGGRRPERVDVDRLEAVMRGWRARVPTPLLDRSGEPVGFEPRSLDDFHPDALLETLPPLAALANEYRALGRDAAAGERLRALLGGEARAPLAAGSTAAGSAAAASASSGPPRSPESSADTLARLLGAAPAPAATAPAARRPAEGKIDIGPLIRAIVADTLPAARSRPVRDDALAAAAEAELGARLRSLLQAPALRALEATWRGIDGLCRNCPDEQSVRFSVLDASFDELASDVEGLRALLGAEAPSILLVDHVFEATRAPLEALGRLLEACRTRDVLLVAGAHPHLAGCAHFVEHSDPDENEYVLSPEARAAWDGVLGARARGARLGLALPRVVLRQPYGADGEPIELFRFEEIPGGADHESFPWGNGAYVLARALGIRHVEVERGVHPDGGIDVRDLPIIYLDSDGESRIKPCAEAWLSERAVGRLRAAGFSVLLGLRDSGRVRVYV